jgi:ferredoxin, 2Fe-2S
MAGKNPYIREAEYALPTQPYTITIVHDGETKLTVRPQELPYQRSGLPGSILDICLGNGIELEHTCGGVCACSTCHVYVKEGFDALSEQTEREEDILDKAFDVKASSRLGCQSKLEEERTYVVEITRESRQAFLDEHPEIRAALARGEAYTPKGAEP